MKKITVTQLMSEAFNPISHIEELVEIDIEDIEETIDKTRTLLSELENMNEALFFKSEKLKNKFESQENKEFEKGINKSKELMRDLQIPELGDSISLLERNREIVEMRRIQKYLRYWNEMEDEKGSVSVLNTLLESEIKENWIFLAELVHYTIKYSNVNKKVYFEYSKRIEEKMVRLFNKGIKSNNYSLCRTAFETLKNLEKTTVLLDEFLFGEKYFSIPLEIKNILNNKLILTSGGRKNDEFSEFIKQIEDYIENNTRKFFEIFGDDENLEDYMYGKLFRTKIFSGLEKYLATNEAGIFLENLKNAYARLSEFGDFLQQKHSSFEIDSYMNEGFGQYVLKGEEKEKELFEDIFNILMYGRESKINYVLLKENVRKCGDPLKIYEKLIYMINIMEERGRLIYEENTVDNLIKHFYDKMLILVETVVLKGNMLEALNNLSHMFLLTRRYFGKRIKLVTTFVQKLEMHSRDLFEKKITTVVAPMKQYIDDFQFLHNDSHEKIISLIKKANETAETFTGLNRDHFYDRVFYDAYENFYKQIFRHVYTENELLNLQKCVDNLYNYTFVENRIEVLKHMSHLKEICKLIVVEKKLFKTVYYEYKNSITDKELRDIIKCRKDRGEIKHIVK